KPEPAGRTDLAGHVADVIGAGRLLVAALAELGVEPDVAAGHGLGEWAAMIATGMLDADAAEPLVHALDTASPDAPGTVPDSVPAIVHAVVGWRAAQAREAAGRSEEHTSELQSREKLVCRLLIEKKK